MGCRRSLRFVVLGIFMASLSSLYAEQPNVVVIMTDDQGYGDLGATGNTVIDTPYIDSLSWQSASMDVFYVSPVCTPTRACLMTGRYNYRTRAIDTYLGRAMMDTEELTIAEVLGKAGYRTGIFGKWHLGDCYPMRAMDQGFQESLVHKGGGLAQPSEPLENAKRYTDPILFHNGKPVSTKGYCTDVYFDAAIEFMSKSRDAKKPFFAYIPTNAPHGPFHDVPERLYSKYKDRDLSAILEGRNRIKDRTARVFAMIENIDENVGKLLGFLRSEGLERNTIIIYLHDNGPNGPRYVGNMRGTKSQVHEGGVRTPFYVRWPARLKSRSVPKEFGAHIDLFPTLLDMTGVAKPAGLKLDGRSLLPLLDGSASNWPERTLTLQTHRGDQPQRYHHFMTRDSRWKLLRASGFGKERAEENAPFELYDLEADPRESKNLFDEKPDIAARLKAAYDSWFDDVSSTRPDNYAAPRIVVGTDHETETVLSAQDWKRELGGGWGATGHWLLKVAKASDFKVKVILKSEVKDAIVEVRAGKVQSSAKGSASQFDVGSLSLAAGPVDLGIRVTAGGKVVAPYHVVLSRQQESARQRRPRSGRRDAKNRNSGKPAPARDPELAKYAIFAKTAPRPKTVEAVETSLPLRFEVGDRIAFIGNALLEQSQRFGYLESLLQQKFPEHRLVFRNLSWPADTPDLQPRPTNFADTEQHLHFERADVIFAAFGFNESFGGDAEAGNFRRSLEAYVAKLKTLAFNGETAPRVVLVSPIANENVEGVAAADANNEALQLYTRIVKRVAAEQKVGFVDVFFATKVAMEDPTSDLTMNGCHLDDSGYQFFAETLYRGLVGETAPKVNAAVRSAVVDKNSQYFRRFRPVNTYYYTGSRNKSYGYLDFLPAMRSFDLMVANRDRRIWDLAQGKVVTEPVDDSNVPPLPDSKQSRGANRWMSAKEELAEFKIDPRFDVNLFAGEEDFPELAAPIQMRWDGKGRLWVSCSTTYPHVYPGNEPNDKIIVLEDTDKDGRADKSSVFADDLHIPLSFVLGDGGVYVSEEPHLTFLKDTDGDGKADYRRILLTGFGTEDSHHALHDFTWTPDGDLLFREAIFHHSQVETPYGPVRQANSGWFRFRPSRHHLLSFGTYHSTNPWGVTFDRWGQHVASHPIFASAFHSRDPAYPKQHARPSGLRAYSGTCGQEFVDFDTFPEELQGHFIKARYKPTNRIEIHKWVEGEFGYDESYVSDLIFSSNLSFIPVDIRFGPRGAMYVCDWYNPIKGHAQYSLRDERRDRHSGRIWRITTKGKPLQESPRIADATIADLIRLLERKEYRYRYWAKRELRSRDRAEVEKALRAWSGSLKSTSPDFRHHQVEALWLHRTIESVDTDLLRQILSSEEHHARAAAVKQLRYWHKSMPDAIALLRRAANDPNGLVRMEAAIAATYMGSKEALDAILDVAVHPRGGHLDYAFTSALGSATLKQHWEGSEDYAHVPDLLKRKKADSEFVEQDRTANQAAFDSQKDLAVVRIGCVPERMRYSVDQFTVRPGQPVKLVFYNPDATDHNLVIVKPDALEEVGTAANDMAKDPANASSDFVPADKAALIIQATPMIGPTRKSKVHVLRFKAPAQAGIYPYVCTFPGHWVVMFGDMVVAGTAEEAKALIASRKRPTFVKDWKLADLEKDLVDLDKRSVMRGLKAFRTARCHQCHAVNGHGATFGPDLTKVVDKYRGKELLKQILEPSAKVEEKFLGVQIVLKNGNVVAGTVVGEDEKNVQVVTNPINPEQVTRVAKRSIARRVKSKVSSMPEGMLSTLTKEEVLDLLGFLEAGGYKLPSTLKRDHAHKH